MPRSHLPLRALMISMGVMSYLAVLALGALLLVNRAVDAWSSDIAGEITLQIRPTDGDVMAKKLDIALDVIKAEKGVKDFRILSKVQARALLEPWLGDARILSELPIPQLVALTIDRKNPPDLDQLANKLRTKVRGASLDTHSRWQAELTRMGSVLRWLGTSILVIVTLSAIGLVIYASRAALDVNRQVVEVLHLVGAADHFIARQVQWQFLKAGLVSSIIGTVSGLLTFAVLGFVGHAVRADGLETFSQALISGPFAQTLPSYLTLLQVPIIATLICLVAARVSTMRMLRDVF